MDKKYYKSFGLSEDLLDTAIKIESDLKERFYKIDEVSEKNLLKVTLAMKKNNISAEHLNGSSGYGYNDFGRDALEAVYADIFNTQSGLVRLQINCGTHAISTALFAILRPQDELLSPVGAPYDTLKEIIGINPSKGSLKEFGITYKQVDLKDDFSVDYEGIEAAINDNTKMVTIQRSKGYSNRPTLSVEKIGEIIRFIKSIKPEIICFVDNCYGEFVEEIEPTDVGADLVAGSLIKNPGGGLAPMGGYIVGKKDLIDLCAIRLSSPGLGKEVGASLNVLRSFYQGLFMSPTVVAGALKGAIFAAKLFEKYGFDAHPKGDDRRFDIIQAVKLNSRNKLLAFCKGIQSAAPVDSFVTPVPSPMPGYDDEVIMAAGAFVSGSSMELSADGPLRAPYNVYFQGGLSYAHAKLGILFAMQEILNLE